jgi:hypothetical protein
MGFLNDEPDQTEGERLANEQIRTNKAELEAKKQSLFQTRLDIIKGQGKEQWEPNITQPNSRGRAGSGGQAGFNARAVGMMAAGAGFPFGGGSYLR